jgi:hypothetical protein
LTITIEEIGGEVGNRRWVGGEVGQQGGSEAASAAGGVGGEEPSWE